MRILVVGIALLAVGCASKEVVQVPQQDPRQAVAAMVASCAESIEKIVASPGDAASKVAGVGSIERLCGGGGAQLQQLAIASQQPQQSVGGMLWNGAVQVFDLALRAYGFKTAKDIAVTNSNNQAQTTIASYGAFTSMGGSIERAGIAGYPYVQAPGATNTYTLSGTGTLGSGSYVGPVTTTRNCYGGTAGQGGAGSATAPGGAGGGAPGGNC